ncbi:hypothetical protein [Streptomyces sp. Z26]|uniref:hypothetical protein n=1 Tax=Streptomyces sp. Z26 TaxID=2500177 RepID=UPI0014045EC0|nr:hypothetical protein [Streptomyces sp. Z26]
MTERRITCRYLKAYDTQCTAEAVDPGGEVLLCIRHLAAAQRLVGAAVARDTRENEQP